MIGIGCFFSDETKINQFPFDGYAWCWVRYGESQSSSCESKN
jgi:hypothetical protein